MTFIEPFLLWGAGAVAIPIAIHFWHQKRGKPLPWAATQWLTERNQQQSRGLRLDNVLLLVLRCLLLILLALLLAQPLVGWLTQTKASRIIHLVDANALVTANFRFELDEARRKGEPVVLMNNPVSPLSLQTAIHNVPAENTELHLYIINTQSLTDVPAIIVPARFRLHTVIDSTRRPRPYLALPGGKRLYLDQTGQLTGVPAPAEQFQPVPVHSGPIRVRLDYQSTQERQTVRAALGALSDVPGLALAVAQTQQPGASYDWVLTDQPRAVWEPARNPKTLFTVSANGGTPTTENVVYTADILTPQTSELVAGGQLPEWLGNQLLRHYGLTADQTPLPQRALNALFVRTTAHPVSQQAGVQNALTLLLVVLLIFERWIALTRNA